MTSQTFERVSLANGGHGTLRWRGLDRVGVELDATGQGEGNGFFEGELRFQSKDKSAVFVSEAQLRRGRPIEAVILERYADELGPGFDLDRENSSKIYNANAASVSDRKETMIDIGKVAFTLVESGRKKSLESLSLDNNLISHITGTKISPALLAALSQVKELDLSHNLISSFAEAFDLAAQFPALKILNLSKNRFDTLTEASLPELTKLEIEVLILNECDLPFAQIDLLSAALPKLKELFMAKNSLSTLALRPSSFPNLEALNLDENSLLSQDIGSLSNLHQLKRLVLSENQLTTLECFGLGFASLEDLVLNKNQIGGWAQVYQLVSLPKLKKLRFMANPVVVSVPDLVSRSRIISNLPKLEALNGSDISSKERIEAEKSFVAFCLKQVNGDPAKADNAKEPSFKRLVALHGVVSSSDSQSSSPSLIDVTLKSNIDSTTMPKKLPRGLTLMALKSTATKLLKIALPPTQVKVFYTDSETPFPMELDGDQNDLSYLGVRSGGTLIFEAAL